MVIGLVEHSLIQRWRIQNQSRASNIYHSARALEIGRGTSTAFGRAKRDVGCSICSTTTQAGWTIGEAHGFLVTFWFCYWHGSRMHSQVPKHLAGSHSTSCQHDKGGTKRAITIGQPKMFNSLTKTKIIVKWSFLPVFCNRCLSREIPRRIQLLSRRFERSNKLSRIARVFLR